MATDNESRWLLFAGKEEGGYTEVGLSVFEERTCAEGFAAPVAAAAVVVAP